MCSIDTMAEPSFANWTSLFSKHPPAPANRRKFPEADIGEILSTSSAHVLSAIKSFPPGSSSGPDCLRPQHLKDMSERQVGGTLIVSLTNFVNLILSGGAPDWVRQFVFGASLLAFNKKDGGLRPIAVGMTLR